MGHQRDGAHLDRAYLNGNDRDEPVEQADDVEEPGGDLPGDDHGYMLVLRPLPWG